MSEDTSDEEEIETEEIVPESQRDKVFAEDLDAFCDALESLYIPGNISGRNHFRAAWPFAGTFLFDYALNEYDADGTGPAAEREDREAAEQKAEAKQNALTGQVLDLRESSVYGGALEVEYVEKTIQSLGRDLALYVYAEHLVDRFAPGQTTAGSGWNLDEITNIVQFDFRTQNPISYHDLVKQAEAETSAPEPVSEPVPETVSVKPTIEPIRNVFNSYAAVTQADTDKS